MANDIKRSEEGETILCRFLALVGNPGLSLVRQKDDSVVMDGAGLDPCHERFVIDRPASEGGRMGTFSVNSGRYSTRFLSRWQLVCRALAL